MGREKIYQSKLADVSHTKEALRSV